MTSSVAERSNRQGNQVRTKSKTRAFAQRFPSANRLLFYAACTAILLLLEGAPAPIGHLSSSSQYNEKSTADLAPNLQLIYPMDELKNKLALVSSIKGLRTGIFVFDPTTKRYIDLDGQASYSAASMIKVPVLISLLIAMDKGEVKANQKLEIKPELVASGSGILQWRRTGTKLPVKDVAELMITISDNTATNMIIDLLGGKEFLNQQFTSWGLTQTKIHNWLADFEGTNTTSPYDLVYMLSRVDRGELISNESRNYMYKIMEHTRIKTLLPQGLPYGTKIAHKTGDIASMVGDTGIITCPTDAKYIVAVQVERPRNDRRANLLIRSLSKMIYGCFSTSDLDCSSVPIAELPNRLKQMPAGGIVQAGIDITTHNKGFLDRLSRTYRWQPLAE